MKGLRRIGSLAELRALLSLPPRHGIIFPSAPLPVCVWRVRSGTAVDAVRELFISPFSARCLRALLSRFTVYSLKIKIAQYGLSSFVTGLPSNRVSSAESLRVDGGRSGALILFLGPLPEELSIRSHVTVLILR